MPALLFLSPVSPRVFYTIAHPGLYLGFSPIITANWIADGHNTWTVPLGLGAGQIFKIGKQAMNAQMNVSMPE